MNNQLVLAGQLVLVGSPTAHKKNVSSIFLGSLSSDKNDFATPLWIFTSHLTRFPSPKANDLDSPAKRAKILGLARLRKGECSGIKATLCFLARGCCKQRDLGVFVALLPFMLLPAHGCFFCARFWAVHVESSGKPTP